MSILLLMGGRDEVATSHDFDFTTGSIPSGMTFTRAATANGASYFDNSGVMQFAGTNVARFDYDPATLALKGLLYEPSATNICARSNTISSWDKGGETSSSQNVTGLDGTISAWTVTMSGGTHRIQQGCSVSTSTGYSFSFWSKRGTMTNANWAVYNNNIGGFSVSPTTYYSDITSGLFSRVAKNFTSGSTCTSLFVYLLRDSGVSGTTLFTDVQLETGSSPTSYIQTTTVPVTRAADQLTWTIPSGETGIRVTFDDDTTQDISVSAGSYTLANTLNRFNLKYIDYI